MDAVVCRKRGTGLSVFTLNSEASDALLDDMHDAEDTYTWLVERTRGRTRPFELILQRRLGRKEFDHRDAKLNEKVRSNRLPLPPVRHSALPDPPTRCVQRATIAELQESFDTCQAMLERQRHDVGLAQLQLDQLRGAPPTTHIKAWGKKVADLEKKLKDAEAARVKLQDKAQGLYSEMCERRGEVASEEVSLELGRLQYELEFEGAVQLERLQTLVESIDYGPEAAALLALDIHERHEVNSRKVKATADAASAPVRAFLAGTGLVSEEEAASILSACPSLGTLSPDAQLRPLLDCLVHKLALSRERVAAMVHAHPELLHYGVTEDVEPVAAWLQSTLGMSKERVATMIFRHPRLLGHSVNHTLAPALASLRDMTGLPLEKLRFLVTSQPEVLGYDVEARLVPTLRCLQVRCSARASQPSTAILCPDSRPSSRRRPPSLLGSGFI